MCMSIVASAFQYGCAPTLMPATTMLISRPAWVNSMIRLSARATQSMFSVPESIEIRAPAERAYHSTGTSQLLARSRAAMIRAHSASATAPSARVGSPLSTTRRTPSGCKRGRRRDDADDDAGLVESRRSVDGDEPSAVVEVVLDRRCRRRRRPGPASRRGRPCRGGAPAAPSAVVVERLERLGRRKADGEGDPRTGLVEEAAEIGGRVAVRPGHAAARRGPPRCRRRP